MKWQQMLAGREKYFRSISSGSLSGIWHCSVYICAEVVWNPISAALVAQIFPTSLLFSPLHDISYMTWYSFYKHIYPVSHGMSFRMNLSEDACVFRTNNDSVSLMPAKVLLFFRISISWKNSLWLNPLKFPHSIWFLDPSEQIVSRIFSGNSPPTCYVFYLSYLLKVLFHWWDVFSTKSNIYLNLFPLI